MTALGTDYGKIVRQLRKDRGMTLAALGKRCGIPWRTVQDFERGRHTPSINRAEQILAGLGCTIALHQNMLVTSLDQMVEELYPGLSVRVVNFLRNSEIVTVRDLTNKTCVDLLRTPNFGRKSLEEVEKLLASAGLRLKEYAPHWRRSASDPNYATGEGTYTNAEFSCRCNSGLEPYWVFDARHIPVKKVCDDCREEQLRGYRPEIFTDPNYYCDEEIG